MMWTIHIDGGPRRVNHAAVSIGDKIYSFGGHNSTELHKDLEPISVHMLNTSTLRWCKVVYKQSNVPYHRYGHTTVAYGQLVYMWGGRNDTTAFEKLYCFNTDTLEWSLPVVSGSEPLSKDGHSACVIRKKMYIFGGFEYATNEYSNELHCLNLETFVWTYFNISNLAPSPRDFHTAVGHGNKMYVFGGRSKPVSFNSVDDECYCSNLYCFDTVAQKWMNVNYNIRSPPEGRRSHSAWVYKGCMYIFGGYNGTSRQHFNNLSRYSFRKRKWENINVKGHVPCVRRRQACVLCKGKVYLFGGTSPGPDLSPSTTDSRRDIRDVIEIFHDVIQGDRDVRRLQNHIEMAEDIILPVVNELPIRVQNAIEIAVNEPEAPQERNDNERIHNGLDRFINIRLRINGVIDRLNNQIAERNMQNHLNVEHNNRVYRVMRGGGAVPQLNADQNPMDADAGDGIPDDIEELPNFEDYNDSERLHDNDDLYILDYAPTLKTLSALAVVENKIDQSSLPQTLVEDLQIMTMPNHISKPLDKNEETRQ